jgi:hypothetical protein
MTDSTNKKIVETSYKALLGHVAVENSSSGWCLRVVRQIVQEALGINSNEFYAKFFSIKAHKTDPNFIYSRDIQVSLRSLGYEVPENEIIPGDLFFSWKPMPYGHVGIVLSSDYVLENTSGARAVARNGFLCVSRLDDVKKIMPIEFYRLP